MGYSVSNRRLTIALGLVFVVAAVGVGLAMYYDYRGGAQMERDNIESQLTAIVRLKLEQIEAWRNERYAQALNLMGNPVVARRADNVLMGVGIEAVEMRLEHVIRSEVENFHYESAILLNPAGDAVWECPLPPAPLSHASVLAPEVRNAAKNMLAQVAPFAPEFVDFYRVGPDQTLRLAVLVPILNDEKTACLGVLALQIDPGMQLYRVLARWPLPSESGEVLLMRQEGEDLVFLGKLRYRPDLPGQFRIPLAHENIPAVRILKGATGLVVGMGYAGKPSVALGRDVPDTPWFLIARMDEDEAFAGIVQDRRYHLITFGIALLALFGIVVAVWRWQLERAHRVRIAYAEAQMEQEQRYRKLFDDNPHPMWIYDMETLAFLKVNQAAIEHYGYSREEFLAMTIRAIRPPEDEPRLLAHLRDAKTGVQNAGIWRHRLKSGDNIRVEITRSATVIDGRPAEIILANDITLRLEAEEALRKTAASLNASQRIAHLGNWDWNVRTNALQWSEEVYRIFGRPPKPFFCAVDYDYFANGVHPEDRERVDQAVHDALHGDAPYDVRHRVLRPDGTVRVVHEVGTVEYDDSSVPMRMVGNVQDITEQVKSEEELRASEERLRLALAAGHQGIFDLNLVTGETSVSPEYASMIGYDPLRFEETNQAWRERLHQDDRVAAILAFEEYVAGLRPSYQTEFRLRTADGTYRWILSAGEIVARDVAGVPTRMLGTHTDITALKNSTNALRAAQERLQRAVHAGNIGLWDYDLDTGVFEVSPEWCRHLGCDHTDLTGTQADWTDRIHPDDTKVLANFESDITSGSDTATSREFRMRHNDGSYRWILGAVSFVRDADGRPVHVAGANIDITERKRLEMEFNQAQKMESVGRLAGGVAHDFNNLLAVIGGYAELALAELPEEEPLHRDLLQIKHAAERAAGLTRQLLAFSRRQVLKPEVLDLNVVITDSEKMLRRLIGEDVSITLNLEPKLGHVMADPGQIEQVLLNLAVNSRDAMPHGGRVTIETSNVLLDADFLRLHPNLHAGPCVRIAVADTGIGMDKDVVCQIFEPFFTTKEQGKGTGLGLATVYGIVQQSGGSILVQSEPAHGTTFEIYLPRLDAENVASNRSDDKEPVPGREVIMLVEDEDAVRAFTERALRQYGYRVHSASSGPKALALMGSLGHEVQLLLTDVIMPGLSGRELALQLEAQFPALKVLYMSGYTDDALVNHGVLEAGIELINKPFSIAQLTRKIRTVLDPPVPT